MEALNTNCNEVIIEQCTKKSCYLSINEMKNIFVVIILNRLNRETIVGHKFILLKRRAMVNSINKNHEGKKTVPSYVVSQKLRISR